MKGCQTVSKQWEKEEAKIDTRENFPILHTLPVVLTTTNGQGLKKSTSCFFVLWRRLRNSRLRQVQQQKQQRTRNSPIYYHTLKKAAKRMMTIIIIVKEMCWGKILLHNNERSKCRKQKYF